MVFHGLAGTEGIRYLVMNGIPMEMLTVNGESPRWCGSGRDSLKAAELCYFMFTPGGPDNSSEGFPGNLERTGCYGIFVFLQLSGC